MVSRPNQFLYFTLTLVGLNLYSPANVKPQCREQQRADILRNTMMTHFRGMLSKSLPSHICFLYLEESKGGEGKKRRKNMEKDVRGEKGGEK